MARKCRNWKHCLHCILLKKKKVLNLWDQIQATIEAKMELFLSPVLLNNSISVLAKFDTFYSPKIYNCNFLRTLLVPVVSKSLVLKDRTFLSCISACSKYIHTIVASTSVFFQYLFNYRYKLNIKSNSTVSKTFKCFDQRPNIIKILFHFSIFRKIH